MGFTASFAGRSDAEAVAEVELAMLSSRWFYSSGSFGESGSNKSLYIDLRGPSGGRLSSSSKKTNDSYGRPVACRSPISQVLFAER